MKRTLFVWILIVCLVCVGCSFGTGDKQFTVTYWDLFDTVTTVTGSASEEAEFQKTADAIYDELVFYHRLFDIYNDYEGISNLKTINDNAGIAPVKVDAVLIEFLMDCREYYELTDGKVNAAMGSVLKLWHDCRETAEVTGKAALPDAALLREAAEHTGWDTIVIDDAAGTVYISDSAQQLDVGAIAKGWAAARVAESAPSGFLISVGGNVCATGPKDADGTGWIVGIQDPDNESSYIHKLSVTSGAVVTSGDYQRYYVVDGKVYHHIIDPQTRMPSEYWKSVTVICGDSGLADVLSTALFLMPQAEGQSLLDTLDAEAMWIDSDGNRFYSSGFDAWICS